MLHNSIGVTVARFQVPDLHSAHRTLLSVMMKNHVRKIVFLGVSPTPLNKRDPLSFEARKQMLQKYIDENTLVLPLPNSRDNESWSKNLDSRINEFYPGHPATMYAGRDGFLPFYMGRHEKFEIPAVTEHAGVDIRGQIKNEVIDSIDFRKGVIHAIENTVYQNYETVDIAMLYKHPGKLNTWNVLMAKKPGENKWRFPGGFVELGEKLNSAAARELMEETGLTTSSGAADFTLIGDYIIDDWRIRNVPDKKVRTFFFACKYFSGHAVAQDDIESVAWVDSDKLHESSVVEEHHVLVTDLKEYISNIR